MYEIEGKEDLIWWWALKENGCWDSLLFVSETRFLNDFEMMFIYLLLKPDFWTISVCVGNFEEGPGTHDMNNTSNMKHLAFGFMCGNYVAGWSLNRASEYLKLFEVPKLWKMFSSAMIITTHTHPTLQNVATQETMPPTASNLSIMILFMFLSSNLLLHPKWLAGYIFLSIAVTETQQVSTWTKIFTSLCQTQSDSLDPTATDWHSWQSCSSSDVELWRFNMDEWHGKCDGEMWRRGKNKGLEVFC